MSSIALVTGAAVRLGRGLALHLADRGYDIALHYGRSERAAEETAAEIRARGRECRLFAFDFLGSGDAAGLFETVSAWGRPELLINSASLYDQAPVIHTDRALLEREFAVNLFAPFDLIRAFARAGGRGQVINVLDNKIAFQQFQYAAYLLSKKALAELTKLAAVELGPWIRVNGLAPGVVLPAAERTADYVDWRARGIPLGRKGEVNEITRALDYLIDNEFVTGQILIVDGGESLTNVGRNAAEYESPAINEKNRADPTIGENGHVIDEGDFMIGEDDWEITEFK